MDHEIMDVLQTIVTKIGDMDQKIGQMDQKIDKMDQRIDRMDQRIDKLDQRIDSLEHEVRSMNERQMAFEFTMSKKVDALFDGYQQNLEKTAQLEQRMDKMKIS